ncbi:hypothetical protein RUM44_005098 [Polyplax serrata]|uniref:Uncharacterized protein n=1 Tax=Polyplax serrata TaxID=468196 RepID=A0ABR1AE25_POLSC
MNALRKDIPDGERFWGWEAKGVNKKAVKNVVHLRERERRDRPGLEHAEEVVEEEEEEDDEDEDEEKGQAREKLEQNFRGKTIDLEILFFVEGKKWRISHGEKVKRGRSGKRTSRLKLAKNVEKKNCYVHGDDIPCQKLYLYK